MTRKMKRRRYCCFSPSAFGAAFSSQYSRAESMAVRARSAMTLMAKLVARE